ncbi:uncharacterized protein CANTADRAFT_47411 [Suhomyces tanzawaensis NRRL Y-17324]|uniref:HRQ family protein 1 n=1 Tax=Suhomyces tanzawaensis NRRL Y-17324 TaxID=984487 RepID=A0A1E4SMW7_9ASCO|nr:uncharacterized protein CANTADRAFT_47411 [Suhomyces tanzawaensis NRRL Y-17324]ODV80869.1 hypothetical protein CANTADRAFT_47411 [Suhomyces tanzawaensis NRRL Y-17324]
MPKKKTVAQKVSNKDRKYGHWVPETFVTPLPQEYPHWDYEKTKPLPYRAFKHRYNVTMGIRNMEWDNWIELDNEWELYHNEKLRRIQERGTELYETSNQATDAAYELLDEFKRFLPHRYPKLFKETAVGLDNLVTKESFDFTKGGKEDPILIAAKLVQDDLAIMMEDEEGNYLLQSGAIILAGFWRFRDKYKMSLNEIHTSGDVPQYNEKLKTGMTRFFTRLTSEKPVVRNNYFIQTDDNLGWSHSIGEEDSENVGWNTAVPASIIDQLYFRSERQSLRRLPKSGAVVFTIRTYFVPIVKLCKEPYIPRRLLNGISTWSGDVEEYKGYSKYADVLLPYLEKVALEQEKAGLIAEAGPDVYPF